MTSSKSNALVTGVHTLLPLVALNVHNLVSDSAHPTARALATRKDTFCVYFLFVAC